MNLDGETSDISNESYEKCPQSDAKKRRDVEKGKDEVLAEGDEVTLSHSLTRLEVFGKKAVSFLPILTWLPRYKWHEYFHGDLIAGLTVGIMHVPQGMAYASLANLPPIHGLYSSFFASTFYMFFGTSRHISIGAFAVASMMMGATQNRLLPQYAEDGGQGNSTYEEHNVMGDVTPLELSSALTFSVGLVQLIMAFLHLGFVTTYLSDPLISGFTTGAAAHVFISQVNKVFGVRMPVHSGLGMVILIARDIILSMGSINWMAFGISMFGIVFLLIGRDYVNPLVKKKFPIPLPLELILVIIGTIFSITMNLHENYGIKIVNTIPRGFPSPSLPRFSLMLPLLSDAIPTAVICYIFVVSMGKVFAKKHKYRTDPCQEMYAVSFMSLMSSFFPVYPVGASLSRSAVCEMSGAHTLLNTLFSSSLLLTVILFLGPLLEPLPMCVLACIVMVSLKSLFLHFRELPRLWKISKYDFAIWLVACFSTVLCDVTKGLIISVIFGLLTIVLREQWPSVTDEAIPLSQPNEIPENVKVLKFDAPLHFVNTNRFIDSFLDEIQNDEDALLNRTLIVDCSAISYVDSMAVDAIKEVYHEANRCKVRIFFACLNESILQMLDSIDFHAIVPMTTFKSSVPEAICSL